MTDPWTAALRSASLSAAGGHQLPQTIPTSPKRIRTQSADSGKLHPDLARPTPEASFLDRCLTGSSSSSLRTAQVNGFG